MKKIYILISIVSIIAIFAYYFYFLPEMQKSEAIKKQALSDQSYCDDTWRKDIRQKFRYPIESEYTCFFKRDEYGGLFMEIKAPNTYGRKMVSTAYCHDTPYSERSCFVLDDVFIDDVKHL
jgi:hypothetical protein